MIDTTTIAIRGSDRIKWLNNLTTNDVRNIENGKCIETFVTDVKGRTITHGLIFHHDDQLLLVSMGAGQGERLLKHFDRYIIREDVTVEDASLHWTWSVNRKMGNQTNLSSSANLLVFDPFLEGSIDLVGTFAIDEANWGSEPPSNSSTTRPSTEDVAKSLTAEEFLTLRIRNRWPMIGIDYDDRNLPQELDRDSSAISFHKGCYLGQETVARLDALGQVQKKLVQLLAILPGNEDRVSRNEKVYFGEHEAGTVCSVSEQISLSESGFDESARQEIETNNSSARFQTILAYVKRAYFASGTQLTDRDIKLIVK